MPDTEPPPTSDSPLEARILAGDITGVMDLFDAMDSSQRKAHLQAVQLLRQTRWGMSKALDSQHANRLFRAVELAHFFCSTELPQADYWMYIDVQDITAFRQRYRPEPSSQPIDKQLHGDHQWHYRNHVHRAVIAGLIERPQTDEYLQALFFNLYGESNIILKHLDADPGLAPYLLQLFDHEGSSDGSFAAVEKYSHADMGWTRAFLTLCERGVYTRTQLLERTLSALACDWPQFKSGWFSRFHESLAPSVDEMAVFAPRYLALCHSRIAPTVGLAMDVLAPLYKAGHVDDTQVCEAVQPVLSSAVKGRVLAGLELLGQVVNDTPARAAGISAMAVHALAHTAPEVQKKVIACLQSWGLDADGREAARGYLPFVSAVNQRALGQLLGQAQPGADAGADTSRPAAPASAVASMSPVSAKLSPLDPSRAVQALEHVADLVERIAYVFENPTDLDEWDRAAAALVRLAPIPAADQAAFLALKKRAGRLDWESKPLGFALAQLMACALDGESPAAAHMIDGSARSSRGHVRTHHFIALRANDLMAQAASGLGLSALSAATHLGGFLDPRQLVARLAACQRAGAILPLSEQVFALMRLVPASVDADAAREALQQAASLKDQPLLQALRYALGDAVDVPADRAVQALFVAAARIRSPGRDDGPTLAAYGSLGPDGPTAVQLDWHVRTSEPNESGYFYHTLRITCMPELQSTGPDHHGMALCAKHMTFEFWQPESDASAIRFTASLQPSNLEPFFAEGARAIGNNLDWWGAQWQSRVYLDVLLLPTTPITPMACLLLAVALAGKEPGQTALAMDALTHSVQDGRLDIAALGKTLARLWATPLLKGPRLGKSLAAVVQVHAAMPAAVFGLLCAVVEVQPEAPRKDLAPLLELLLELKLTHGLALPAGTRTALQTMRPGGKSKQALKEILG